MPASDDQIRDAAKDLTLTWYAAMEAMIRGDLRAIEYLIGQDPDPRALALTGVAASVALAQDLAAMWQMVTDGTTFGDGRQVTAAGLLEARRQQLLAQ